jgi:crotonobetainyl-CoA:carnitine CoA-transferase CaiB-like acyl-CoA transferase
MRHVGLPIQGRAAFAAASEVPSAAAARRAATETGPLAGVRVLDFGNFVAGPHGSVMLGDLGAEVIKVESLSGDPMRPYFRAFTASNRGKRGLAVDLKTPEGVSVAHRLCAGAHMVHHNFRPGVAERIGIDVATLSRINPRLIVLETSGYGSEGPKAQRGGLDMVLQALCGHEIHAAGKHNPPMCYRLTIVDYTAGILGTIASLMAFANQPTAQGGAAMNTNLLNSGIFLLSELIQRPSGEFAGAAELNATQTGFHPAEQFYRTSDGWVAIAVRSNGMVRALSDVLELGTKLNAPRARWGETEAAALADAIAQWKTAELVARLDARGVWIEECRPDASDRILDDPVMRRAGVAIPGEHPQFGEFIQLGALVGLSRSPLHPRSLAPGLGEHTRSILSELGYSDAEVDDYFQRRIVA